MKKILLLISISILTVTSYAQIRSFPPLKVEDVDFSVITDENYSLYKLFTTIPSTVKKEVNEKNSIKNFDWKDILTDNSMKIYRMATNLFDSLQLREPLAGENPNYLYLHAKISNSQLPLMMQAKLNVPLIARRSGDYLVDEIPNLYKLSFIVNSKLTDGKKNPIKLGKKCEVTTHMNFETEEVEFTIALEIEGNQFNDIHSGNIELNLGNFKEPEKTVIRKTDVGKTVRFHSRAFDVLAFENGVLHLRYIKKFDDTFKDYKYIGNINGEKFNIKCPYTPILYIVYEKYRNKPKLDYAGFEKYNSPKSKVNIDMKNIDYNVALFNFGYDIDSLNVYLEEKVLPTMLKYAVSVTKQDDKYNFRTIVKNTPALINTETNEKFIMEVRRYFRENVKYPAHAVNNRISGTVRFNFKITVDGGITDVNIISSPDKSFSEAVLAVAARANFKFRLGQTINGSMALQFNL